MSTGLRFTLEVDGLPPDAFAVVSFHLNQSLSSLFSLDLSLVSQQFLSLEFAQVLDKMAYLTIWQGDEVQRRVKGVVTWFELGENDKNQMLYSMKVHPPLWRAGLRQNFRIFQNEDIKSILGTMLQENGVTEWSPLFSEPHPSREFCVQYGETDYDFLCRMAAEEGIFFYEEHAYKSTDQSLVLCDTVRHLPESFEIPWNPNTRTEVSTLCISQFRYSAQIRPSSVVTKDYTFKRPGWAGRFEQEGQHQDYYGLTQGLLSVLRLFWGNLINFMANWRALKQVLQHGDPRRVAWDKTTHDFPSVTGDTRSLRPLGQILLENQVITEEQLDTALRNRVEGLRLGGSMLMQGLISAEQLAQALAEQNGVAWESIDAWQIPSSLIAEMPASVALHYAVLPLRLENDELIVGSEDGIDPVSLAALTRKVGRKVRYVIVLRGQIVTGLRHWYARRRGHDPRAMLYNAVQHQWLTEQQTGEIWRQYVPHQFLFAEILTTLGHINRSAINVLLLRHERSSLPLGKFLVTEGVISQETLDRVLTIQRELQVSMQSLLLKAGLNTEQVAQLESENEGE